MSTLFNILNTFVESLGESTLNDGNNNQKNNNKDYKDDKNNNNEINDNLENEEDKNKILWPENEDEEDKQFQLALKQSEEEAKKFLEEQKEEERQLERAIKESERENNMNTFNFNNNNFININELENTEKSLEKEEEEFDDQYGICPLTLEYMKNPVLTPSGNYFEKTAIIDWINRNGTEPFSREKLTEDMLIEDEEYKKKIIEYRKKFNK